MENVFTNENVKISDDILSWKEAINLSAKPLLDHDYIGKDYLDAIYHNIDEFGPYIDFGFELAVPHARPEFGVKKTGVSLLKLNNSINLMNDSNHPIKIIITFCSVDNTSHIDILKKISEIFGDQNKLIRIKNANSVDEILNIINK
ncbi:MULTISPECIES: PTS sugar transporter subunit IIA [Anaerococcus]|uniref:Ascorbate-specific PTS system EIIA component n=1 Tax=Anaerococcus hydrogenalis TaxID=33029 RepID=A0A2N6UK79_9FIRM|nr:MULTISPECIES: PTS sugar transporter subunit IIA [Anaerococcus]MDK7694207.1 PTS sugar transporter subunit IIA [Anaerococcus hydrogenalis]MDK7695985.1 PTS sugar transporter subunit IIA [Anaerococcus hydrogenalis]MDK7707234.1 PTS sugar transporter subunit IIA [Anaerococcus hydrogenalis]MDU4026717.1 PTS sugar transporter subunit IIA [Anaerococcus sp.]PMC82260.1 hypothetical protein CJ192_00580 [Anaerococcus hydrogenalis]